VPQFTPPDVNAAAKRPTLQVVDPVTGYTYDTSTPVWKNACAPLPSFAALQWPGYATTYVPDTINGVDVIIQAWMGDCQQFLGRMDYPGGLGGEVGVYVLVPEGRPLPDLTMVPLHLRPLFEVVAGLGATHVWWPDADMQPEIDFTIVNPVAGDVLVSAPRENNYWVNRWMEPQSYKRYKAAKAGSLPPSPIHYKMVFTVAGCTREWSGAQLTVDSVEPGAG
jgi:hypothetical protein